jgi:SAM-dependent methyltransferase
MVKIDFGCGPNKKEGFLGVDQYAMKGVDIILDIVNGEWPWADGEVEEAHASHFVEHLTAEQRCKFFNNLYRVMKPGGTVTVICPHWASNRAYGDPTHQWPPFAEFALFYLDKEWRAANAPHTDAEHWAPGYSCDFTATWGYSLHPTLNTRNLEFQQFALNNYKEAASDIYATLTKR